MIKECNDWLENTVHYNHQYTILKMEEPGNILF